jgi:hypothetical protein
MQRKDASPVVLYRRESNVSIFGGEYRRGLRSVLPGDPGRLNLGNDMAKTQEVLNRPVDPAALPPAVFACS